MLSVPSSASLRAMSLAMRKPRRGELCPTWCAAEQRSAAAFTAAEAFRVEPAVARRLYPEAWNFVAAPANPGARLDFRASAA